MAIEKVNLAQKFSLFHDHWSPKIAGEINDFAVKLVKQNEITTAFLIDDCLASLAGQAEYDLVVAHTRVLSHERGCFPLVREQPLLASQQIFPYG